MCNKKAYFDEEKQRLQKLEKAIYTCSTILCDHILKKSRVNQQPNGFETPFDANKNEEIDPIIESDAANALPFQEFAPIFHHKDLAGIRTIGYKNCEDSTFILSIFKAYYKENLSILKNKALRDLDTKTQKDAVTPEKFVTLLVRWRTKIAPPKRQKF